MKNSKFSIFISVDDCKWFCTVTQNRGVIARTTSLQDAQKPLGKGNQNNRQAIIPMKDRTPGDPHTLPKQWSSGSMWWWNWPDINQMRDKCAKEQPLCKTRSSAGKTIRNKADQATMRPDHIWNLALNK